LEAAIATPESLGARQRLALDAYVKLVRATESVIATLQPGLTVRGLTIGQFGVLECLLHVGPMCQRDLGEKLLRSGSNITTVIDNLERRGLASRSPAAEDRRKITVRLTEAGRRLVTKVFAEHAREIATAMGHLGASEQRELAALCRKLGLGVANSRE
jgi:MarR family 2-MHQ and catechol resistance regulon transcriptional repressor